MISTFALQARCVCLLSAFLLPSYGALITYSDRPAFNSVASGLPTETFASGLVNPTAVTTCAGPLSSTTGSACFPTGGLLPGVVYSATGNGAGSMAVVGTGTSGLNNTTNLLGPNIFGDTFNLVFTQASAVGFDVFAGRNAGNVSISIYNPTNTLLGAFTVSAPITGTFFGVTSNTDLIGSISILSQAVPPGEVITNLSFGVPSSAVPEPCTLLLSGAGLMGVVFWRSRKRSPANQ